MLLLAPMLRRARFEHYCESSIQHMQTAREPLAAIQAEARSTEKPRVRRRTR